MKLELEHTTPMRAVNYFGSNVYIPAHHIAISADPNGTLYSYDCVPKLDSDLWVPTTSGHDSVYAISGRVLFDDPQEWSRTLRVYPLDNTVKSESLMSGVEQYVFIHCIESVKVNIIT